jgi:hypothetical protein
MPNDDQNALKVINKSIIIIYFKCLPEPDRQYDNMPPTFGSNESLLPPQSEHLVQSGRVTRRIASAQQQYAPAASAHSSRTTSRAPLA